MRKRAGLSAVNYKTILFMAVIVFTCLMSISISAWAESKQVGEVVFAKGVVTAALKDKPARILGKGMPLYEHDVLHTGPQSFTVIKLIDDSRITIRSDTVLALEKYSCLRGEENALLNLFKGGFRAITGFIAKRNPRHGYRIKTPTAVAGVRGTEFDVRICESDCQEEAKSMERSRQEVSSPVVARIARLKGNLKAWSHDKIERQMVEGSPVYENDTLETGPAGKTLVVFRDNSRVVIMADSKFAVEEYQYKKGKSFFRLLKGGLRVLTGLLARRNAEGFKVGTPTAVVGVRGTGFDLVCQESCESKATSASPTKDGLYVHVWEGDIALENETGSTEVKLNQTVFLAGRNTRPILLPDMPDFMRLAPEWRPDKMSVDFRNMFKTSTLTDNPPGLYVTVYDGHVTLENETGTLDLGRGESGYVDPLKLDIVRLEKPPEFQIHDRFPQPQTVKEQSDSFMEFAGDEMGAPQKKEDLECEIR